MNGLWKKKISEEFLARLQSNFGLWIDDVRPSVIHIWFNFCVKVLKLALQSGHTVFSSFLYDITNV